LDNSAVGSQKLTGRMLRTDGSWAWFIGSATVVERAQNGQALRVLVTALDVDARRAAEERHRLSSTFFHTAARVDRRGVARPPRSGRRQPLRKR